MPFAPEAPTGKPEPEATEDQGAPDTETEARADGSDDTWQQERQVRLTAQRILAKHLRYDLGIIQLSTDPPKPRFWPGIRLDLSGTTLISFNLENGEMRDASFDGATFSGGTSFDGTTFMLGAGFNRATFSGGTSFVGATFNGDARFDGATFSGGAGFNKATFNGGAGFGRATFNDGGDFHRVTFNYVADFHRATFNGDGGFVEATFKDASFAQATFNSNVGFGEAIFSGGATFGWATSAPSPTSTR